MPHSLWEWILRGFLPHRHITEARLRDARLARIESQAKLRGAREFLSGLGLLRHEDDQRDDRGGDSE